MTVFHRSVCRPIPKPETSDRDVSPSPQAETSARDVLARDVSSRRQTETSDRALGLIGRTTEIARLAILSPRRTTVIWENPAKRNVKGTTHFCEDLLKHSTVFFTTAFKGLMTDTVDVTSWKSCTFAWCRFVSDAQKYTTFWYTEDAAAGFDILNSPTYQCNHADGENKRHAGGKLADGR